MAVMTGGLLDMQRRSQDPYTQALQDAFAGVQGGFTGPTEASFQSQRVSPQEEESAYQTGFAGLPGAVESAYAPTQAAGFGEVPESRLSGYFDLAQPYMFGQGMEQINAQLAEAGFAPSGTGGIGPQAEMAGRLRSQLGVQQANALLRNAMTGAAARTQGAMGRAGAVSGTARDIGASRYRALTVPNVSRVSGTRAGERGAGAVVQQRNPWETAFANAGGGEAGGQRAGQQAGPMGAAPTPWSGGGGGGGAWSGASTTPASGSWVSWGMPSGGVGGAYDQYRTGERADYTAGGSSYYGIPAGYELPAEAGPPEYSDVQQQPLSEYVQAEQRRNYQRDPGTGKVSYSPYTGGSQYVTGGW